ncbi:hypothetical protein [Polaribacter sargassicola]|uniref:hypothetical protein n=1 Tax=Polaribacter sargassicola TaxID=2836891 RepID=UPI001F233D63|nr:hypothetical protein [Polaribacter sp. DS7-9]MCG1035708.1 hypothetical protein [Polaribacter sp. DS7-9]
MKKLSFIISFLITLNIFSQSSNNSNSFGSGFRIGVENEEGHPYLMNDWYSGNLVKNDGSVTEKMPLNYQIADNLLVSMKVVNGEKIFQKLNADDYTGFIITDDKNNIHIYTKIEGNKFSKTKKENKFYLIVSAPSKNVLLETSKSFKDPNASGWSSSTTTNKRGSYKEKTQTYVLTKSGKYEKVGTSNNAILKVYKDKKNELKKYITENKIKIKEPTDLIKIVEYYHAL